MERNLTGYVEGYAEERWGRHSAGISIEVAVGRELTLEDRCVIRRAAEQVLEGLEAVTVKLDPEEQAHAQEMADALLACFPNGPLAHAKLPNGYCRQACCSHLPWLKVATPQGYVVIGWRKRVISIDWSDSLIEATASALFSDEDVTKDSKSIHAWGYEKATEYLAKLLTARA